MPETPTPAVNGQVFGAPAAQDSSSISSFEPAATTFGLLGSIATAGSFCLFCENGVGGLPTETSTSVGGAAEATATPVKAAAAAAAASSTKYVLGLAIVPPP